MDKGDLMISLYSGTPGSGKSLHTADRIVWALRMKHPVICNFDINANIVGQERYDQYFHYVENQDLKPEYLMGFSREYFKGRTVKEDKIVLIIDESQLLFNAREWDKDGRKKWISFFTQHRKFGYAVILVAQFDRMLDRQIRSLIEYEYVHRKLLNFGWRGLLLSMLLLSPRLFVAVKIWYPMKERLGADFFKFKRKYARLYDTYMDFSAEPASVCPGSVGAGGHPRETDTHNDSALEELVSMLNQYTDIQEEKGDEKND